MPTTTKISKLRKRKSPQMYIRCSLLFAALMISWLGRASCLSNSSYNLLSGRKTTSCPSDGTPVCGVQDKQLVLFSNDCLFNAANKDMWPGETIFRKIPLQNCMQGCKFSCPKNYKPVCVRSKQTLRKHLFKNHCELLKNICKTNVDYLQISHYDCLSKVEPKKLNKMLVKRAEATKRRRRPVPCTNVFRPVCGSYLGVKSSFKNECILNAENVAFNRDWRIVKTGMCPEDLSKTRRRKDKPAKLHAIKKRSYSNILLKQYTAGPQFDANIGNELNVSPSDLYVYMSPTFEDEFLNHDSTNYHHALTENDIYDTYLDKIGTLTPFDMAFAQRHVLNSDESIISPVPFSANRVHFNYMANKNLAHEINQQASLPAAQPMKPINDEAQKQNYLALAATEATSTENDYLYKIPTTPYPRTTVATAQTRQVTAATTVRSANISTEKQFKRDEIVEPKSECEFGPAAICATLTNGTLRTFETLCEMMATNALEKIWAKLHEGPCEDCKYNCSRDYEPVCISKNGVNYTMINECYYNMGICLDKKSKWQLLSNKECDRYSRIPDKYADATPGFAYTSSYYVAETTEMTSTDSAQQVTSSKAKLKAKSSKNKKRKGNAKREIKARSTDGCCSRSHLNKQSAEDTVKCKCWSDSAQQPLSFQESRTKSNIMSLVRVKDKSLAMI